MALSLEAQPTDAQGDEESAEEEPDDAASFGRGPNEERDADRYEDQREDRDGSAVEGHGGSDAVTRTRQGACLRT